MRVNGFDLDDLQQRGTDPAQAMLAFESWTQPPRRRAPAGASSRIRSRSTGCSSCTTSIDFSRRNPFGVAVST